MVNVNQQNKKETSTNKILKSTKDHYQRMTKNIGQKSNQAKEMGEKAKDKP